MSTDTTTVKEPAEQLFQRLMSEHNLIVKPVLQWVQRDTGHWNTLAGLTVGYSVEAEDNGERAGD